MVNVTILSSLICGSALIYIKVNTCLTNQGLYGLSEVLCYSITVNSVMPASEHRENKKAWNKNA